jgi:cytoskeletal protein RodZ
MWYIKKIFCCYGGTLIGEVLKKRREELGLDLREISQTLKIKYAYLKALEEDDLKGLPAEVYVKGYINEYAKTLNLDPEPLLDAYNKLILPRQDQTTQPRESNPVERKGIRFVYVLVPLVIIFTIIYLSQQFNRGTQPTPPPVPQVETKQEKQPAEIKSKTIPAPESSQQTLEVHAHDATWLQVITDGTQSHEVLMKPGDSAQWVAKHSFSLKIGNAGGISILLNGKDIGKLGEKGQVVKINLPSDKT